MINDSSLYCIIAVVIALLPIIINLVSVDTISEHGYYSKPRWVDHYGVFMINTEGFSPDVLYFRQIDLFSDLSRNTTSPSSPTSSNDLSDPEENAEFESDFETNLDLNSENGVSIGDTDGNSDSTSNSSLINP